MFDNLGDLGKLKDKAEEIAEEHGDKIADGLEKAGDLVDEKTDGKHSEQIDTAVDKAQDLVERLAAQAAEGGKKD
ncbi:MULTISPECIES: antitoxin [unclassified Streptomyces]|uniref:antitoxin n=1 Tax=unclassified Streptomyces TaxID=2593676 RepID=UPI000526EBCF|nr:MULTISPECIES: antitoxin [unclassified Streptomyces]WOX12214.1 antitoxin [Streptomyces sp. N50]